MVWIYIHSLLGAMVSLLGIATLAPLSFVCRSNCDIHGGLRWQVLTRHASKIEAFTDVSIPDNLLRNIPKLYIHEEISIGNYLHEIKRKSVLCPDSFTVWVTVSVQRASLTDCTNWIARCPLAGYMYMLTAQLSARLSKSGNLYRSDRVIKSNYRFLAAPLYIQILTIPNFESPLVYPI